MHKSIIIVSLSLVFLHIFSQLILLCVLIEGTATRISPRSSSTPYMKVRHCDSCTASRCTLFARRYSCSSQRLEAPVALPEHWTQMV